MIAYLLSPAGQIGRRAYALPVAAFFALAAISAFATGSTVSASTLGIVLDNPWGFIGRGVDASLLPTLPFALAAPLGFAVLALAVWACFALTIKRLHDLGRRGWWSALLLLPGLGFVLMLVCALVPGRRLAA